MTQENEIKRPTQDLEHEPIKQLDNSEKGGKVSQALETVTTTAEKVQRQPVIAHLIRATERFNDRLGNQFGAAITYFSFLSMIPILMVSFAAGGFVLASHPMLLQDIFDKILQNISDPTLAATLNNTINTAVHVVHNANITSRDAQCAAKAENHATKNDDRQNDSTNEAILSHRLFFFLIFNFFIFFIL